MYHVSCSLIWPYWFNCCLVQYSHSVGVWLFATPWTAACQASLSSPRPGACSNSRPSSRWCRPTISSSLISFSSCLQSFPASGSFLRSQFFASGGQSIRVSVSALVLAMNIQDWFSLGLTGLISLQSKGLFKSLLQHHSSKASVRHSAFFMVQLSKGLLSPAKEIPPISEWRSRCARSLGRL